MFKAYAIIGLGVVMVLTGLVLWAGNGFNIDFNEIITQQGDKKDRFSSVLYLIGVGGIAVFYGVFEVYLKKK